MHFMDFMTFSRTSVASVMTGLSRLAVAACMMLPALAAAQSARDSALYVQAQQMVANGDAAGGRALADSVASAAPAGSAAFAEGLYWRGTLAANARDSEHAYRQIIVDYPLSGRVPDALLRIGQIESSRGENAAALQHFQRLVLEHPQSPLRPEASYWVAQMYFAGNDAPRACAASTDALSSVPSSNIELRNRIDFQQQRCRGVAIARDVATASKAPAVAANSTATGSAATGSTETSPETRSPVAGARTGGSGVVSRPPTREEVARVLESARKPASSGAAKATAKTTAKATVKATATKPAASKAAAKSAAESAPDEARPSSGSKGSYAVQIAAFGTKQPATLLVAKLRGRGYDVYVDGKAAPYRVRIGHYPTYAAAAAALVKLKAKQIDGFVAER
jgi:septal ring-binding cell division protein DamX